MQLIGKVAVVTGGSSGIGEAVCHALSAEGASVAVVASSDIAKSRRVADALGGSRGRVAQAFACDIRDAKLVNELVGRVVTALGPIDILVNSAGLFYPTPAGGTSVADVDRIVDLNIKGTFHCINAVVPAMKQQNGGKIVNLSSFVGAVMGFANYSLYAATKAAVIFMTKSLARELAGHNINVNAVAPGCVRTPMNEALRTAPEFKSILEDLEAMIPSRTKFSSPADIARVVSFLVSDSARLIHGSVIVADEGISAGL
jgi:NAD(P)-dependent dehydrogenase (short-subunit alcohol dehydrogenase family)